MADDATEWKNTTLTLSTSSTATPIMTGMNLDLVNCGLNSPPAKTTSTNNTSGAIVNGYVNHSNTHDDVENNVLSSFTVTTACALNTDTHNVSECAPHTEQGQGVENPGINTATDTNDINGCSRTYELDADNQMSANENVDQAISKPTVDSRKTCDSATLDSACSATDNSNSDKATFECSASSVPTDVDSDNKITEANLCKEIERTSVTESTETHRLHLGIEYVVYQSELQMPDIMNLITKDLSEPYSIYTYRYFIHNWPKLCFLAMYRDRCVGAIVCKLDLHKKMLRRGYIGMLAVDSEFRRLAIGSHLVMKAIRAMVTDECDEVVLETEVTNKAALRLYENLGFVHDKRLFRYYLNGVDAVRLKLWLR